MVVEDHRDIQASVASLRWLRSHHARTVMQEIEMKMPCADRSHLPMKAPKADEVVDSLMGQVVRTEIWAVLVPYLRRSCHPEEQT